MVKKEVFYKGLFILFDIFSLSFPFLLISIFLNFYKTDSSLLIPNYSVYNQLSLQFFLSILCSLWFWLKLRHYTYRKPFWVELKEIIYTLVLFVVIELSMIAFFKLRFSRTFFVLMWLVILILFPLIRFGIKYLLIKSRFYKKETVIIGVGENAFEAYEAVKSEFFLGLNITYFVDAVSKEIYILNDTDGKPLLSPISNSPKQDIFHLVNSEETQFILALEEDQSNELDYWIRYFAKKQCRAISIVPNLKGLPIYNADVSFIFSHEIMLLRVANRLAKRSSRLLKRTMDIVFSLILIITLSPVLGLIYFWIANDGGSAIYSHKRVGMHKKVFPCFKFRTMVLNSDEVLRKLLETNPEAKRQWEKDFKLKNDPRITKIGRFLRKTSLDELPQLFNVLRGDMSLVGPRPIVRQELIRYRDELDYYLMVRPGMTGLWQISGRNNIDYATRVYYDAWYVRNWSIWNDIVILVKTVKTVLDKTGAY